MSVKMALRRFSMEVAASISGGTPMDPGRFEQALMACFADEGSAMQPQAHSQVHSQAHSEALLKKHRVILQVLPAPLGSAEALHAAWGPTLSRLLDLPFKEAPHYAVLTDQARLFLYDLRWNRAAPRLSIAVDDLSKYSEAFVFLEPSFTPGRKPTILNIDKVSAEVAALVGKLFRALRARGNDEDKAIRFTLRSIVAMFSEDIGLLPKEFFTTLLYRVAEEGIENRGERLLYELFEWMSTPQQERREGADLRVPFFNGGLFSRAHLSELVLGPDVLRALTKAAEANWSYVDPHIFGSVFQGVMNEAERHASGAHYTAKDDILRVVEPTILAPLRARFSAAKTLKELKELLSDLGALKILDPACGSGNFLYVAFRQLYALETQILLRIFSEFPSAAQPGRQQITWATGIRTTNFFGIDNNAFAVELAKTTLNIAKKIAFEERCELAISAGIDQIGLDVDPSLPLDNLDANIRCEDALFCAWPKVDAIIGNPPFLGSQRLRAELGGEYVEKLREAYPEVGGDLCAYWFRRAHDALPEDGRAGFVATSAIRFGDARKSSLDYIVASGGYIHDAISSMPWPGEALVNVSVVSWAKERPDKCRLVIGEFVYELAEIHSHLQLVADVSSAKELSYPKSESLGVIFGSPAFQIKGQVLRDCLEEGSARPIGTGADILTGKVEKAPRYVAWITECESEEEAQRRFPAAYAHLKAHVYPSIAERAADAKATAHYKGWIQRWWGPQMARDSFLAQLQGKERVIVCPNVQSRPVFLFLSTEVIGTNTLELFAFDDDYTFGLIQSSLHWAWTKAKGGRLKTDIRYTSAVWKTFPWPQEPNFEEALAVASAAQELRKVRAELMAQNEWNLRDLYRSAEVQGPHPLNAAQAALDAAVEKAFGKPKDQEATAFLLEMNQALAEDEAEGLPIVGPGLPPCVTERDDFYPASRSSARDNRWFSEDCIQPPARD